VLLPGAALLAASLVAAPASAGGEPRLNCTGV
jgi:hypothetical protein